jgi:hypothetical protein
LVKSPFQGKNMAESQPASGNVLILARVRNSESRAELAQLLDDLPGERINASLYELFTADWDIGLWTEEVERMQAIIDPDVDTLIYWQAAGNELLRTCLAGRTA